MEYTPSFSNLSRIARSIKYDDWDHYCAYVTDTIPKQMALDPDDILVEGMRTGYKFILGWYPLKYAKLKYLGNLEFEIIETEGCHRKVGDIIIASGFRVMKNRLSIYPKIGFEPYGYDECDDECDDEPYDFLDPRDNIIDLDIPE